MSHLAAKRQISRSGALAKPFKVESEKPKYAVELSVWTIILWRCHVCFQI